MRWQGSALPRTDPGLNHEPAMLPPAILPLTELENPSEFAARHLGPDAADEAAMLSVIGAASRRALVDSIVPRSIARAQAMDLPAPCTED